MKALEHTTEPLLPPSNLTPELIERIGHNLDCVKERIEIACKRCGRSPQEVTLMAVSKTQPLEALWAAYLSGQRLFGENRVAEGAQKRLQLPRDANMVLIGHLQSNKAKEAAFLFDGIQSIDKVSTLQALEKHLPADKVLQVLFEVNTSGEDAKEGVRNWQDLLQLTSWILEHPRFSLQGLMTMAPFTTDPLPVRRSFAQLRRDRDLLEKEFSLKLPVLSMGMSGDFEWAIEEGSSLVRVGTLVFGGRM